MRGTRTAGALSAILGLAATTALTAAPVAATAAPQSGRTSTTQTIAPGLTLTKITDPSGPYILRVLTIDPSKPLTIDIATAGAIGTYAKTSVVGDAHGALAAINGDFTVNPGRPLHPFAEDGSLKELGLQNGASFAISKDEANVFIDNQAVSVKGKDATTKKTFSVTEWNTADPKGGDVVGYTPYGGSGSRPPKDACSVRLKTAGKMVFGKGGIGVSRNYKVVRSRCTSTAMAMRAGTTVLSSHTTGAGATLLKSMKRRHIVKLRWSFGWNGVMDSVGGMPLLVEGGYPVAPATCSSYFCSRNPRTGIGVTADGKILMVTVDGRKSSSVGMTLIGFAKYMVQLGAEYALNLDGGGGSTMWVSDQGVVNDPSDSTGERPVTNTVLVLPGVDPGEPAAMSGPQLRLPGLETTVPLASTEEARRAAALSATDPGSIGGLMDALVAGDFGDPGALPPSFLRYARVFRAAP
jgi:exopolysaccharide biosynthesis protein